MKQFSRIEPTTQQVCGLQYKRTMVVKTFKADDDSVHEFAIVTSVFRMHNSQILYKDSHHHP